MPTRNVNLTEHFEAFVQDRVASGHYQNASEVVREGLRLLEMRDEGVRLKLERLREAVRLGEAAIDDGAFVDIETGDLDDWLSGLGDDDRQRR